MRTSVGPEPAKKQGMRVRGRSRTATRWLFVIGLQVPALLSLQSCKNDRAAQPAPVETQAQDRRQQRAVFGSASEAVSSGTPEVSKTSDQPTLDANRPQQRARRGESYVRVPAPKSRIEPVEPHQSPVGDPGERSVGDGGVAVASNRAPREPAAERFLHYRPPGSSVGDTGELTGRTPEPQISASMKPVRDLIRRWADTLLAGDLGSHMSLYAPTLDRFNGSSNVPRVTVRASKQRLLSRLAGVRRFEMYDVRVRPARDGSVHVEFRIESDAVNRGVAGWYRLELRPVGGLWKIYGEEKVQPVSRRRSGH